MATRTTKPFPFTKGGRGCAATHQPPHGDGLPAARGTGAIDPAHRDHALATVAPTLPPTFQGTLTKDHWKRIPANVRKCFGLPLGTGAVQDWVLSNAARKVSLAQEEATRAHIEVLATAEVAQAKAITSHMAAEPRT